MSDAIKSAWAWRLIIFKCFNNWFTVTGSTLCASNVGAHYAYFSERSTVIILALIAGSKAIEAFLNQDLGQMKARIAAELTDTRIFVNAAPAPQPISTETKTP